MTVTSHRRVDEMADADMADEEPPKKKSKLPMLIGVALALVLGGGGFFAVYSGMILGSGSENTEKAEEDPKEEVLPLPEVAFIELDPLVINLGPAASNRYLRFRAQLEVNPEYQADVTDVLPRVLDVLNSYLRAVSIEDLEDPSALIRLRAQMLRRVKIVTGEGRVRDLLIMEFVLN